MKVENKKEITEKKQRLAKQRNLDFCGSYALGSSQAKNGQFEGKSKSHRETPSKRLKKKLNKNKEQE